MESDWNMLAFVAFFIVLGLVWYLKSLILAAVVLMIVYLSFPATRLICEGILNITGIAEPFSCYMIIAFGTSG